MHKPARQATGPCGLLFCAHLGSGVLFAAGQDYADVDGIENGVYQNRREQPATTFVSIAQGNTQEKQCGHDLPVWRMEKGKEGRSYQHRCPRAAQILAEHGLAESPEEYLLGQGGHHDG